MKIPIKETHMQLIHKNLVSLVLGAAFVAPMVIAASPLPQDRKEEKQEDKKEQRYYDRDHKDYHTWDAREDAAFRRWLEEKRYQTDRAFSRMKSKEQSEYWKWRHEHPDNDTDRH
jgi:hypothetical protein